MRYVWVLFILLVCSCGSGGGGSSATTGDSDTTGTDDTSTDTTTDTTSTTDTDTSTDTSTDTTNTDDTTVVTTTSKFSKATAEESARFLTQTTFGPSLETIQGMTGRTYEEWLQEQFALTPTLLYPMVKDTDDDDLSYSAHVEVWWKLALESDDQLRQRVAFALSEIFVISDQSGLGGNTHGLTNYYDILIRNSFGDFRTLLEEVTLSPMMGLYLSMLGNQKPNTEKNIRPDENYAREIMQLFTIGLYELNIDGTQKTDSGGNAIPTYDQKTIEAFAHIYTGWTYRNSSNFKWPSDRNYLDSMVVWKDFDNVIGEVVETYHDESAQTLLNGVQLLEKTNADEGLQLALDTIFNHANVGPFISKQLIQRLVTSNPSPEYVARVAAVFNSNSEGARGDLKAVVEAIFLDDEARVKPSATSSFGKVKEPILRLSSMWRAFKGSSNSGRYNYSYPEGDLKQGPFKSPTVFNFFSPSYSHQGEIRDKNLLSPELQIHDESSVTSMSNRMYSFVKWRVRGHDDQSEDQDKIKDNMYINLDLEKELSKAPDDLIAHLNLLLLAGEMSDHLKGIVKEIIELHEIKESHSEDTVNSRTRSRATDAIMMILNSPEFNVQR